MQHQAQRFEEDLESSKLLIRKYLRYKNIYFLSLLLFLALGYGYMKFTLPLYRIQSSLLVKGEEAGNKLSLNISELDALTDMQSVENEIQIIKSNTVLRNVVVDNDLNIGVFRKAAADFFYNPVFYDCPFDFKLIELGDFLKEQELKFRFVDRFSFSVEGEEKTLPVNSVVKYKGTVFMIKTRGAATPNAEDWYKIRYSNVEETVEALNSSLVITSPSKNASLLFVSFLHPSKQRGEYLLNEIVKEYNAVNINAKRSETDTLKGIIRDRLALLSGQLKDFEGEEEGYKIKSSITNLSEDVKVLLEKSKVSEQSLYEAKLEQEMLQKLEQYIISANESLSPPNLGINDPVLITMVSKYNDLQLKRREIVSVFGSKNAQLEALEQQIKLERKAILDNIGIQKGTVTNRINKLNGIQNELEKRISKVPSNERRLLNIIREKTVRENIYVFLLQKLEEASLSNADALYRLRVIDRAYSSVDPVKPNKALLAGSAVVAALLIPTLLISLKSTLEDKVKNKAMIKQHVSNPVIAEITRMRKFSYNIYNSKSRITIEQMRLLRTRLQRELEPPGGQASKILITSSTTGEGKTFISINLAISFALNGRKTLLIDLDLRNPDVAKYIPGHQGKYLNNYLNSDILSIENVIEKSMEYEHLYILYSTKTTERIPELPVPKLDEIFSYCNTRFDVVLINTPPFAIISDALQLEKYADATLFVVKQNYTDIKYLELLNSSLKKKEFKNLHLVFNDVQVDEVYGGEVFKGEYFS